MPAKTVIVGSSIGLHARPAAIIAEAVVNADNGNAAELTVLHVAVIVAGGVPAEDAGRAPVQFVFGQQ